LKNFASIRPDGRRVYIENGKGLRVPLREIALQEPNPPFRRYDTSGPYGDPDYRVNLDRGLPRLREAWIRARGDVEVLAAPGSTRRACAPRWPAGGPSSPRTSTIPKPSR